MGIFWTIPLEQNLSPTDENKKKEQKTQDPKMGCVV